MLKQIVKENVKAILSENKKAMSVSFAVLIPTLEGNPKMVKLLYNLSISVAIRNAKWNQLPILCLVVFNIF